MNAIESLKISQIESWRRERLGDATVIGFNKPLIRSIADFLYSKNSEAKIEISGWMESLIKQYDYKNVIIADTSLKVRISFVPSDTILGDTIREELKASLNSHSPVLTDFHKSREIASAHLDMLIPLYKSVNKNQEVFGIVILRIDPAKILFPLIQSWPTQSKSSETLLLSRDGDSVLYLNELRHSKNTALKLKLPLTNKKLLATKAVNGFEGVTEGVDYRNILVIGSISRIPETPWYMVAKVDKEEILLPLQKYSFLIVLVIVLLVLINASIFGFWIWQQRIKFYNSQLKNEVSIHELEERFTTAFRMSPVSVSISSLSDNKFIDVNNTFLEDLEYEREEVIGRTAKELDLWANETERIWLINEIAEKGKVFGKVIGFKSKTGKVIFGLTSISVIHVNGEQCNLSTVVNITENKKAEMKLLDSEELFRKLFENMLNGFAFCEMINEDGKPLDFLYINVNESFATLTGLKDVIGKRASEAIPGIQESDPELLERYNRVSSSGVPEVFETYVESLQMWFAISVYSPHRGYFVAVFDVISARKLTEKKLDESRAILQSIIDNSNSLIYLVDTGGRFVMVNQPLQALLSPSGEALIGQSREAFMPKKIADLHRKNDLEVFASGKTQIFEEENIEPDGTHYYLTTKFPLYNQNEIYAVGGLSTDITGRKKIEKTLKESEEKFRKAFLTNPDSITITRLDNGTYVSVNDGFTRTFEYSEKEVLGKTSFDISIWVNPDDRKQFIKSLQTSGKVRNFETKFYSKSKKIIDCLVSASTINLEGVDHVLSNVRDITERKHMDEALHESEDKFKYVFDHSPIGKSITYPTGEIHVNKAFCDMLGYTQTDLEKTKWQDISHPEDIEITQSHLNMLLTGEKESVRFIKRYFHKNGEIIWADVGTSLRRDHNNNPLYFMTAINDITERKASADALQESEERFSKSFKTSPISFMIANLEDGRIMEVNDAFSTISGYSRDEAISNTTLNLKIWVNELDRADMIDSLREGKAFLHHETQLRSKYGKVVTVLLSAQVIKLGNRNCIISSIEDITKRKQAEKIINNLNEELEQKVIQRTELLESANKELEAFSYSVSHDLRAPLRSVHGFTKILLEDYVSKLDDEGKRICAIISSSATQMGELIDDLLSFSRIGRSSMNPSEIDMKKMAAAVFEGMASPVERKRIKLTFGQMHMAFGDVALFGQVWTNLISNAIKYTSKNLISKIIIGSKVDEGMITYFIKDNGVGFEMKYAHKLFGVFSRLHSEAEFEGNGVGLAIIQRIILKHGGKVWAEGEVGKGATFYFSLPVNGTGS